MVASAVAGKPLWTSLYLDFDEISKYITTVTFPGKICSSETHIKL
jgi:hypothetical protein